MRTLTLLLLTSLALSACSSSEESSPSATDGTDSTDGTTDGTDATDRTDATDSTDGGPVVGDVVQPGPVCTPGDVKGCSLDEQSAVICNAAGDGYETRKCKDDRGEQSQCQEGVGCLPCLPGKRRCLDDNTVQQCEPKNGTTSFITFQTCDAEGSTQVCTQGACVELCEIAKKLNSYMGCDYWAADLDNAFVPGGGRGYYDAAGAQYAIVVSNPSEKKSATVEVWNSDGRVEYDSKQLPLDLSPIPPKGLRVFELPRRDVDGTVHAPLAYRVTSSIPITAYQFNPLENVDVFSNDASILLPENVLDKWYVVMTREQTFDILRGYLTIIAVSDTPTEVAVTVTAPTLENKEQGIPALKAGETLTRTLSKFDVLNIETNRPGSDLTGSVVLANNRVAVFGGSEAANAPNTASCKLDPGKTTGVCVWDNKTPCETPTDCIEFNTCCADHLEMQMFPVRTWGVRYVCARTQPRGKAKDVWRIMAAEDNTVVTTVPPQANIPVLNAGEWYEFESDKDFEIVAKKPVLVGQFLAAQDAPDPNVGGNAQADDAKIGDPAFMLAVPYEQYRTDYVFLTPDKYALSYVTVTAKTGSTVTLDGTVMATDSFKPVGTGEFSAATVQLQPGTHSVTSDDKFGIIVYGFDKYVSYGYPGGLDLNDLKLVKDPTEK